MAIIGQKIIQLLLLMTTVVGDESEDENDTFIEAEWVTSMVTSNKEDVSRDEKIDSTGRMFPNRNIHFMGLVFSIIILRSPYKGNGHGSRSFETLVNGLFTNEPLEIMTNFSSSNDIILMNVFS